MPPKVKALLEFLDGNSNLLVTKMRWSSEPPPKIYNTLESRYNSFFEMAKAVRKLVPLT